MTFSISDLAWLMSPWKKKPAACGCPPPWKDLATTCELTSPLERMEMR